MFPLFEFVFQGNVTSAGTTYTLQMSFNPTSATTTRGTFDRVSMDVSTDNTSESFTKAGGTWNGCTMKIAVGTDSADAAPTAPIAANYNGRFTSNDTLVLTPDGAAGLPVITLARNPAGSRDMGCHG